MDLMRPCATVLRNILPSSIPGIRIVCVYGARPVTFSRASRRGNDRPTCAPVTSVAMSVCCFRPAEPRLQRALHMNADQLAFVGGRAAYVRYAFDLVGRHLARA